jgi:hypothetical protein
MPSDAGLLDIQLQTAFVLEPSGRISCTNDPDRSAAPRFALFGCASGNICGVRADVTDDTAAELRNLTALEPPFLDHSGAPKHFGRYVELLMRDAPVRKRCVELTYLLPNDLAYRHEVRLIRSDSIEGQDLGAALASRGIPGGLAEMGFADITHFGPPWCAALHDGEIASIAFAARLSGRGASLGLATVRALRGQGYAAAAVAGWARMEALAARALFYSTDQTNRSSQKVIARLGLQFLGTSLELC